MPTPSLAGRLALAVAALLAAPSPSRAEAPPPAAQGPVLLASRIAANRCMDVTGASRAQGTRLQIWECNRTEAQQFTLQASGEIRVFGMCVDAQGGQGRAGDAIVIWPCNGTAAQRWTRTPAGELRGPNSRCIDVAGGRSATGTVLQLWDCNGTAAQKWDPQAVTPQPQPPAFTPAPLPSGVVSVATRLDGNRCLDVTGASRAQGTAIQLWSCNGTEAQRFTFLAGGEVRVYGSMCLDARGGQGRDGDRVQIWPCNGTAAQRWTLTTTGEIRGINGKCLDLDGANTREGTPVAIHGCHGGNNQRWSTRTPPPPPQPAPAAGSLVTLATSLDARRCLDVKGASYERGTPVQIWECNGTPAQRWGFLASGEVRVFGNRCLDVSGGAGRDGDAVVIWACNGGQNQKWSFTPSGELRGINGKCLDLDGGSTRNGSPIRLFSCHGGPNQRWSHRAAPNPAPRSAPAPAVPAFAPGARAVNLYTQANQRLCVSAPRDRTDVLVADCAKAPGQLLSLRAGGEVRLDGNRCLDVARGVAADGQILTAAPCAGTPSQKWRYTASRELRGIGDRCVDLPAQAKTAGTPLVLWSCNGGDNQRWNPVDLAALPALAATEGPYAGAPAFCFGGVGQGCSGVPLAAPARDNGDGTVTMFVSVGSILHDNCCIVAGEEGQHCGDERFAWNFPPVSFPAGEFIHNQQCVLEWHKATWNAFDGRQWMVTLPKGQDNLTLVSNPRLARLANGAASRPVETLSTRRLAAPPGTYLDVGDEAFCASGQAETLVTGIKAYIRCK